MTNLQGTQAQAPPPPAAPRVDGDELARRIDQAIQEAVSQSRDGRDVGQNIREAMQQVRAEMEAARQEGRTVTIQPRFDADNIIPPQAVDISIAFFVLIGFIIVGLPIARAWARRMDRRSAAAPASDLAPRLDRIEQAIEAIAIEVERVSEGQRFTTKAIAETFIAP